VMTLGLGGGREVSRGVRMDHDVSRGSPDKADEPYRVFRRLLILEGWSHDQAHTPVFS
jgi:hypothetical protein